jgi:hypothetical protein
MTLAAGSAPSAAQWAVFAVADVAVIFVLPGFVWLYWLHQHDRLQESEIPPAALEAGDGEDPQPRSRREPARATRPRGGGVRRLRRRRRSERRSVGHP